MMSVKAAIVILVKILLAPSLVAVIKATISQQLPLYAMV